MSHFTVIDGLLLVFFPLLQAPNLNCANRVLDWIATRVDSSGKRKQAADFTCKVTEASASGKYDTVYYSQAGKRLRSMIAVAKFLSLVEDDKQSAASAAAGKKGKGGSSASGKAAAKQGVGKPRNKRELESEQKKLKKEMDRLLKAHEKATKVLDDHRSDHKNDRYPVEDEVLLEEEEAEEVAQNGAPAVADLRHLANPDIDGFPGIPVECTPDLLMCWDFLCKLLVCLEPRGGTTFGRIYVYICEG